MACLRDPGPSAKALWVRSEVLYFLGLEDFLLSIIAKMTGVRAPRTGLGTGLKNDLVRLGTVQKEGVEDTFSRVTGGQEKARVCS